MEPTPPSFPPPTPVDAGPTPTSDASAVPMSVVITEPPRRSRAGWWIAAGVVLVAVLAAGAFFLLRGDDTPTYSLPLAVEAQAAQQQLAATMVTSAMGTELTVDTEVDNETGLMHATADLGQQLGFDAAVEMIADPRNKVLYMAADLFESLGLPIDTKWVRIDREALDAAGQDTSLFDQLDTTNPVDVSRLLADADQVDDLGLEQIDGEEVRHYLVTLDIDQVLAVDDTLQQTADDLGAELPDTVEYDVFVTKDNVLRRTTSTLDLGITELEVQVTFRDLTEPLDIQIPDESDVTDATDLF